MADLRSYLEHAVTHRASDLFIVAGCPVSEKIERHLQPVEDKTL
jgi:Tfp pilus assembly ATPase PilU